MADITDVIEKLIQLALKNPNPEEASSAALKAVALIDKYQVPIGANITIIRDAPDWKPPTAEENAAVEELLRGRRKNPDAGPIPKSEGGEGYAGGIMIQDQEVQTGKDAFRQRLIDAWRALREERQRLQGEIYRYEQETHHKFRDGEWG